MSRTSESVAKATLAKLRSRYFETWQRDWPYDDEYLRMLWRETRDTDKNSRGNSRIGAAELYEMCLLRMRENHEFDPDK